jgi:hypothetical protein
MYIITISHTDYIEPIAPRVTHTLSAAREAIVELMEEYFSHVDPEAYTDYYIMRADVDYHVKAQALWYTSGIHTIGVNDEASITIRDDAILTQ